jgi:hypothetical protein
MLLAMKKGKKRKQINDQRDNLKRIKLFHMNIAIDRGLFHMNIAFE